MPTSTTLPPAVTHTGVPHGRGVVDAQMGFHPVENRDKQWHGSLIIRRGNKPSWLINEKNGDLIGINLLVL